jgi:hypothetical protein
MSENFERWKELAARCLSEEDPAKLTELASEMNRALNPALKEKTTATGALTFNPAIGGGIRAFVLIESLDYVCGRFVSRSSRATVYDPAAAHPHAAKKWFSSQTSYRGMGNFATAH